MNSFCKRRRLNRRKEVLLLKQKEKQLQVYTLCYTVVIGTLLIYVARMLSEAIKSNPNFILLRQIEAARDIANSIAKGSNKVYLNSDNLLINLLGTTKEQGK